jgi:hypothetical protein
MDHRSKWDMNRIDILYRVQKKSLTEAIRVSGRILEGCKITSRRKPGMSCVHPRDVVPRHFFSIAPPAIACHLAPDAGPSCPLRFRP